MSLYKFSKSSKVSNNWNYQPLIRKSELYYIIAEALDNKDYIDEVRINRGLKKLSEAKPNSTIATELLLEHMREFYGEGQLFYFYKRRNLKSIRNGSTAGNITMNADKYVLPIPQVELDK
ncbi:RagB/SusD family nutrient uptake outer membrane protein [Dysgonomonas sp. Marseille-P4677]|uniref:RagB/SusD family nutrient uptake outer membrane protein n=1 Tax=Dysgonomonas sp. Marseille-P4677 TaxID=2364790 RepID=UPI001913F95D|nr:RagB/SusD family nutrient uptake outer membrane protein [Dysgonomonas sp. Marseille-P4677]MBK5721972.1 RagB/SusD family nutrient uptake outer membrane protein [Dysgonomonas sp. Marseille-P4677]